MTDPNGWPVDYFASRTQFIEQAQRCGARVDSRWVHARGPDGEALSVDSAALTSENDEHLIVLTSGVHGIEGFIGARIQIKALQKLATDGLPDRTGIVMIHAVNPWGFAHLRRVDESNVDVNRNFIDTSAATPVSHPRYAALDAVINPRKPPDTCGELQYWLNAGKLIVRHRGIKALFAPIAEGQYDFPQGVFFGGFDVGASCKLLQKLVLEYSTGVDRVTVLDIHSGLGPSASATLIGSANIVVPEYRLSWLQAHYHQAVLLDAVSSNLYNAQATFSRWCQEALSDKRFLYLCVEFGTVNPVRLFSALRRENQAHHWTARRSKHYLQTKQTLLKVFAPDSRRWRKSVVAQGLQVLERSIVLPA